MPHSLTIDMQHDPTFLRPHFLETALGSHEQGDVSP